MMFGLVVLINIASVAVNWNGDLKVGAIISGVASLWAMGVASNFGSDRMSIPNWAASLSMLSGLGGIGLLIAGVVQN
jgi:hypothetical protein